MALAHNPVAPSWATWLSIHRAVGSGERHSDGHVKLHGHYCILDVRERGTGGRALKSLAIWQSAVLPSLLEDRTRRKATVRSTGWRKQTKKKNTYITLISNLLMYVKLLALHVLSNWLLLFIIDKGESPRAQFWKGLPSWWSGSHSSSTSAVVSWRSKQPKFLKSCADSHNSKTAKSKQLRRVCARLDKFS